MKRSPQARLRALERAEKRFRRQFYSLERVNFVKRLPCVCRGVGRDWGCEGSSHNSHDPSRGAGGTYLDIHPASLACHNELGRGSETFWRAIGRTREEANAETERLWQDYLAGLAA